jgi:MSHA biogenesis protein MshO
LDPVGGDTSFSVLGPLNFSSALATGSGAGDCASNSAACLVVYNTGLAGSNAWNLDNMATLTAVNTSPLSISFNNAGLSSGVTAFPAASSYQRFFIVDTPVKFICDTALANLRRYSGYNVVSSESSVDSHAELLGLGNPAEFSMLADQVSDCSFNYFAGTATRNAVLTISLSVAEAGEDITLLQQLNVVNQP